MEALIEHRILDLMSELGEVAKEVLKMSDYGKKPILCAIVGIKACQQKRFGFIN